MSGLFFRKVLIPQTQISAVNSLRSVLSICWVRKFAIGFSFQLTVLALRLRPSMHVICCPIRIHASAEFPNQGGRRLSLRVDQRQNPDELRRIRQLRLAICGRVVPTLHSWSARLSISPSGSRRKDTVAVHSLLTAPDDPICVMTRRGSLFRCNLHAL